MKLLTGLIFALSLHANAGTAENCMHMGELGRNIMEARQAGVDIGKLIKLANAEKSEAMKELMMAFITEAYKTSRYSTQEFQKLKIDEFYNRIVVECISAT